MTHFLSATGNSGAFHRTLTHQFSIIIENQEKAKYFLQFSSGNPSTTHFPFLNFHPSHTLPLEATFIFVQSSSLQNKFKHIPNSLLIVYSFHLPFFCFDEFWASTFLLFHISSIHKILQSHTRKRMYCTSNKLLLDLNKIVIRTELENCLHSESCKNKR